MIDTGIHEGMSAGVYHALDAMSATVIKAGMKSMLHAQHQMTGGKDPTPAMLTGTAMHQMVLEDGDGLVVWDGVKRGKAYEEFKLENEGATIISEKQMEDLEQARYRIEDHAVACGLLDTARTEVSLVWDDPTTGMRCKARMDFVSDGYWGDYKTSNAIDSRSFESTSYRLGYHVQLAHYAEGLRVLTGQSLPVYIIAQESKAPYDVAVYEVAPSLLSAGMKKRNEIINKIKECKESDYWPGASTEKEVLNAPIWAEEDKINSIIWED